MKKLGIWIASGVVLLAALVTGGVFLFRSLNQSSVPTGADAKLMVKFAEADSIPKVIVGQEFDFEPYLVKDDGVSYTMKAEYLDKEFKYVLISSNGFKFTQTVNSKVMITVDAKRGDETAVGYITLNVKENIDDVDGDLVTMWADDGVSKSYKTDKEARHSAESKSGVLVEYLGKSTFPIGANVFPIAGNSMDKYWSVTDWENAVLIFWVYNPNPQPLVFGQRIIHKGLKIVSDFQNNPQVVVQPGEWKQVSFAYGLAGVTKNFDSSDSNFIKVRYQGAPMDGSEYSFSFYVDDMDIVDYDSAKFPELLNPKEVDARDLPVMTAWADDGFQKTLTTKPAQKYGSGSKTAVVVSYQGTNSFPIGGTFVGFTDLSSNHLWSVDNWDDAVITFRVYNPNPKPLVFSQRLMHSKSGANSDFQTNVKVVVQPGEWKEVSFSYSLAGITSSFEYGDANYLKVRYEGAPSNDSSYSFLFYVDDMDICNYNKSRFPNLLTGDQVDLVDAGLSQNWADDGVAKTLTTDKKARYSSGSKSAVSVKYTGTNAFGNGATVFGMTSAYLDQFWSVKNWKDAVITFRVYNPNTKPLVFSQRLVKAKAGINSDYQHNVKVVVQPGEWKEVSFSYSVAGVTSAFVDGDANYIKVRYEGAPNDGSKYSFSFYVDDMDIVNYSKSRFPNLLTGSQVDRVDVGLTQNYADDGITKTISTDKKASSASKSSVAVTYKGTNAFGNGATVFAMADTYLNQFWSVKNWKDAVITFRVYNPNTKPLVFSQRLMKLNTDINSDYQHNVKVVVQPGEWKEVSFSYSVAGVTSAFVDGDANYIKVRYEGAPTDGSAYSFSFYVDDMDIVDYSKTRFPKLLTGSQVDRVDVGLSQNYADDGITKTINTDKKASSKSKSSVAVTYKGNNTFGNGATVFAMADTYLNQFWSVKNWKDAVITFRVYNPNSKPLVFSQRLMKLNTDINSDYQHNVKVVVQPGEWKEVSFSYSVAGVTSAFVDGDANYIKVRYEGAPTDGSAYSFSFYVDDMDIVDYSKTRFPNLLTGSQVDRVDVGLSQNYADDGITKTISTDKKASSASKSSVAVTYQGNNTFGIGATLFAMSDTYLDQFWSVKDWKDAVITFRVYNPNTKPLVFAQRLMKLNTDINSDYQHNMKVVVQPGEWKEVSFSYSAAGITSAMADGDANYIKVRYEGTPTDGSTYSFSFYVDDMDIVDYSKSRFPNLLTGAQVDRKTIALAENYSDGFTKKISTTKTSSAASKSSVEVSYKGTNSFYANGAVVFGMDGNCMNRLWTVQNWQNAVLSFRVYNPNTKPLEFSLRLIQNQLGVNSDYLKNAKVIVNPGEWKDVVFSYKAAGITASFGDFDANYIKVKYMGAPTNGSEYSFSFFVDSMDISDYSLSKYPTLQTDPATKDNDLLGTGYMTSTVPIDVQNTVTNGSHNALKVYTTSQAGYKSVFIEFDSVYDLTNVVSLKFDAKFVGLHSWCSVILYDENMNIISREVGRDTSTDWGTVTIPIADFDCTEAHLKKVKGIRLAVNMEDRFDANADGTGFASAYFDNMQFVLAKDTDLLSTAGIDSAVGAEKQTSVVHNSQEALRLYSATKGWPATYIKFLVAQDLSTATSLKFDMKFVGVYSWCSVYLLDENMNLIGRELGRDSSADWGTVTISISDFGCTEEQLKKVKGIRIILDMDDYFNPNADGSGYASAYIDNMMIV